MTLPDPSQTHLAALFRVSQSLGASLDLDAVLTQVMDAVIELTHAERGFLMLIEPGTGVLSLRAARNIERATLERKDMEVSLTVIRTVVESGEGVVTTDAQSDPRFSGRDSVVFYSLRSILCAPLRARGQIIGVVYVDNRIKFGVFTANDLNLLNTFAAQAAIVIDNARLYTQTDQALAARISELETLTQIDRELNAQLDLHPVLELTRRWAMDGAAASECWIALCQEESPALLIEIGGEVGRLIPPDDPILAPAWASRAVVAAPPEEVPARVVAPLLHSGKAFGVLVVEGEKAFPETALRFLERLAARSASAIQNARLYQAVQDANLAKTKFVSVVTHELRLPMTSIKGYTDLLRQGAVGSVNEMQLNFLNIIRNNVERMNTLVSDLSDISRIESGRFNLESGSLNLNEYVQETINTLRPRFDEKTQSVSVEIPPDLPPLYADHNRLVQILTNLLSNANKYTASDGKISLCAFLEGNMLRVEVNDTGIGISADDQKQLFSQFFRSEDPAVREQQGWGLGLNVTKKLVEIMGGQIGVHSVYRQGSTFWFTLPILSSVA